ncbi:MAG: polysaccharide deacetylase family protein [Nitrososphaerota archaeon]|nr:polysaccharide deacetylase family protein [Nitrososphaerota archaeon]
MNKKILAITVIIGLLSSSLVIYEFAWSPSHTPDMNSLLTRTTTTNYAIPQEGQRVVCIVFDDGWLTQYTNALPILDEYNFKATFAIITDNPDKRPAYMNWNQIVTLYKQSHDIGSHTTNHLNFAKIETASIEYQLSQSKQDLLKHGINATTFVYPEGEGAGNPDIEKLVQQHYTIARGINKEYLNMSQAFNQYALPSYTIRNSTTLETFKDYVNQADASNIVIIYYQQISDGTVFTSVTTENFATQMQYLYDNGFTVQPLKQLFTSVDS